jgi:hypothetical protein
MLIYHKSIWDIVSPKEKLKIEFSDIKRKYQHADICLSDISMLLSLNKIYDKV